MNPIDCPNCGGRRPVYSSKRSLRRLTQYRRCDDCGELSKTSRRIEPQERRLTPEELRKLSAVLPDLVTTGNYTGDCAVFVVVREV